MRVSIIKSDPGYVKDAWRYEVYLDGIKLNNCVTADEEKGIALVRRTVELNNDDYEEVKGEIKLVKVDIDGNPTNLTGDKNETI